ncbi:SUPPRESSOR OF ABI3-5 isoform X2 [Vigna angularis]|uniref:SUPPRESSOR OF ABI3-5 isoform X2 n=1 Tax=Phaseolus angularis TaxID=3914 RepID=UPI0022B4A775|nr:SUPPRESSOR OF ABI3-5 isoform X2 [Vigna angularis]
MFADEDDNSKPSTDENNTVSQSSSDAINSGTEGGALQNDYVYDESSGYYYSSSLGYYYDPNTGLYCSAASGQWYRFMVASTDSRPLPIHGRRSSDVWSSCVYYSCQP